MLTSLAFLPTTVIACYAGRSQEAAETGTEAIALSEQLALADPRLNVELVVLRCNVAVYLAQGGNPPAASLLALRAVIVGERLATSGEMPLGQLAIVYVQASKATFANTSLSGRYGQRAVELFRQAGMTDTVELSPPSGISRPSMVWRIAMKRALPPSTRRSRSTDDSSTSTAPVELHWPPLWESVLSCCLHSDKLTLQWKRPVSPPNTMPSFRDSMSTASTNAQRHWLLSPWRCAT